MPCEVHPREAWAGSNRKSLLVLTHRQRAQAYATVRRRDGGRCHRCGELGADVVDHVLALSEGGEDSVDNMAMIHQTPCHDQKTAEESTRARARRRI